MKYNILQTNYDKPFIERLLEIRQIQDWSQFFQPDFSNSRRDPFDLNDMESAVDTLIKAMKKRKKLVIFGDYDVDGITASYCLYQFFYKFLNYENVEIKYPSRQKDGYGLKTWHLDEMKEAGAELVITVDNGITSIEEAKYAKKIWLDLIITDHHHPLDEIPEAIAVVNPQISPNYSFKGLAGVGVAFKVIMAMLTRSKMTKEKKNQIFNYFLPVVAIWTVADIVPLIDENRWIVKRGLEMMNYEKDKIPVSLKGFLESLSLRENIDTYHIGFQIWPRINAWWRIASPEDSLQVLLTEWDAQKPYLEAINTINGERQEMQAEMLGIAEEMVDLQRKILIAASDEFHEWVIGLVAGRLSEKYHKPSMIFKKDTEKGTASASLRWSDYLNVIEMIMEHRDLLERFGWHKGAGWLTVRLEKLDELCENITNRCEKNIRDEDMGKMLLVDTQIFLSDWNDENLKKLDIFAPFGEGNQEPLFLFEGLKIVSSKKIWKNEKHLKVQVMRGETCFNVVMRGKWEMADEIAGEISLIGKVRRDWFNGWWCVEGVEIVG